MQLAEVSMHALTSPMRSTCSPWNCILLSRREYQFGLVLSSTPLADWLAHDTVWTQLATWDFTELIRSCKATQAMPSCNFDLANRTCCVHFTSLYQSDLMLIETSVEIAASEFNGVEGVESWTQGPVRADEEDLVDEDESSRRLRTMRSSCCCCRRLQNLLILSLKNWRIPPGWQNPVVVIPTIGANWRGLTRQIS
jgi:hypothetical protein